MSERQTLLAFCIDGERYALLVEDVERVTQMVAVTPLPGAPDVVSGVIDVAGMVVPAISVRKRLGRPDNGPSPDAQLCLARTEHRTVALMVDAVDGIIEYGAEDLVAAETVVPKLEHVKGIVRLHDGLVVINDVESFLSLDGHQRVDAALRKARKRKAGKC